MSAIIRYQMSNKTEQLNLRPPAILVERLEELAEKYKGDKSRRTEVAVEILERFWPHWERAAQAFNDTINQHLEPIKQNGTDDKEQLVKMRKRSGDRPAQTVPKRKIKI